MALSPIIPFLRISLVLVPYLTHSKQTTASVEVIYAATIQDDGAGRLLAVDFRSLKQVDSRLFKTASSGWR